MKNDTIEIPKSMHSAPNSASKGEWISDFNAAAALLAELRQKPFLHLAPSTGAPWIAAYLSAYGDRHDLRLFWSQSPTSFFLFPGRITSDGALRFLCETTSDYNDIISSASVTMGELFQLITSARQVAVREIAFDRLDPESHLLRAVSELSDPLLIRTVVSDCDIIPRVHINTSILLNEWSGVSMATLRQIRRKEVKLLQKHSVTFRVLRHHREVVPHFQDIYRLHIQRWNSKGITSRFSDAARRTFTERIIELAGDSNFLFVPAIFIDGQLVAYRLCFTHGATIHDWITSFDLRYSEFSIGTLLLYKMFLQLSDPILNPVFRIYDFGRGDEAYKYFWTNSRKVTQTARLHLL